MWILILSFFLWSSPGNNQTDYSILIVDDCSLWEKIDTHKISDRYSIAKAIPVFHRVWIIHNWIFPEDKLSIVNMTYSQILRMNPQYTSELNTEDWNQLAYGKDKKKIYMLRPDDYCSEKRFVFNQEFVLYEVRIHLSGDE
jgi:hypothetical protein